MWCVGELTDEYIKRMEDILDLYEEEDDSNRPVVCIDEKLFQLLSDVRPSIPMKPGRILKRDYEYKRESTANIFCAVEPKAGKHFIKTTPNRTGKEFAQFMRELARRYPRAAKIRLVMDNLNTHNEKTLIAHLGPRRGENLWNRFEVHYTPTHGSWLNQAETAIGIFVGQYVGKTRVSTLAGLRKKTRAWNKEANERGVKFEWKFTKKIARKKMGYQNR